MAFCYNCGSPMDDSAAFCSSCGTRKPTQGQQGPQAVPVSAAAPVYPTTRVPRPGRGYGISSMVLGIVGLVYGFYMFLGMWAVAGIFDYYNDGYYFESAFMSIYIVPILILSTTAILAITFSILSKKRGYQNRISKSGMITGIVAACFYGLSILLCLISL